MSMSRFAVAILLFAGISGCSSGGQARSEKRAESMKEYRAGLEKGSQQIDTTLTALDAVVTAAAADPRPAYQNFKTQLAVLDDDASNAAANSEALRAKTQEYLDKWEEETASGVKNPEIAKINEQQRADAKKKFEALRDEAQKTRDLYKEFSRNLHEIDQTLGNNLNKAGIEAMSGVVKESKAQGKKVQAGIASILGELKKIHDAFVPPQAPPPGTTPPANT